MKDVLKVAIAGVYLEGDNSRYHNIIETLFQTLKRQDIELVLLPAWEVLNHPGLKRDGNAGFASICKQIRDCHVEEILNDYRQLASKYNLMVGFNLLSPVRDRIYNRGYLISSTGEILGTQDQVHLAGWEVEAGLVGGNEIEAIDTPLGKMGFILSTDAFYPEIARILALKEVDIVLAPTVYYPEYSPWDQLAGIWQVVQQNQFFALENPANFAEGEIDLEGIPAIYGPCDTTQGETGFIGGPVIPGPTSPDMFLNQACEFIRSLKAGGDKTYQFTGVLRASALHDARRRFPIRELFNVPLYNQHLNYISPE